MSLRISLLFKLLFVLYIITGIYLSSNMSISHDEWHEQNTWEVNLRAILSFFNDTYNYEELLTYKDRYFGIAFHIISQPFQYLLNSYISDLNNLELDRGYLVSRHIPTFLIFSFSGIIFYKICIKISKSEYFSYISSSIYLTYPYLFGHSLMNPKDIPLMSFWLICTFYSLKVFENYLYNSKFELKSLFIFLHKI